MSYDLFKQIRLKAGISVEDLYSSDVVLHMCFPCQSNRSTSGKELLTQRVVIGRSRYLRSPRNAPANISEVDAEGVGRTWCL